MVAGTVHMEGLENHLWSIIGDKELGFNELGDDFNSNEAQYVPCCMCSDGPHHGPLFRVVNGGDEKSLAPFVLRHGFYNVKGPLFERT